MHQPSGEAVVLFEPMRNVLDVDRRLDLLDGLLDGHDVHADAATTWRDDVGDHRGSQICDALEVGAHLGMLFEGRLVHGVELAHAGQLHGQREALFVVRVRAVEVLPVVLEVALLGHEVHERLDLLERPLTSLGNLLHGHGMPNAHVVGDVGSFLGENRKQAPALWIGRRDLLDAELFRDAVDHHLRQLHRLGTCGGIDLGRNVWVHGLVGAVGLGRTPYVVGLPKFRMLAFLFRLRAFRLVENLHDDVSLIALGIAMALAMFGFGCCPMLVCHAYALSSF